MALYTMRIPLNRAPETIEEVDVSDLPEKVDWRDKGWVTPVKNQGDCGSCWAFSVTGTIEGAYAKANGKLISLSEQQMVNCDPIDHGCNGGSMNVAYDYIIRAGGLDSEESYPYTAKDPAECKFSLENVTATISGYKEIKWGSETELLKAVAEVGPISVGMNAGFPGFQDYHSGVVTPDHCPPTLIDHGVLAVGYGHEKHFFRKGQDYWLIKNSWGSSWGMDGYFKIIRNDNNMCGIATMASYPLL